MTRAQNWKKRATTLGLISLLLFTLPSVMNITGQILAFARSGDDGEDERRVLERRDGKNGEKSGRGRSNDNDETGEEHDERIKRKLKVHITPVLATVQAKLEGVGQENKVQFFFKTAGGIVLTLHFKSEMESESEEAETKLDVIVKFLQLREFIDTNANGRLDANETIVQSLDLTRLQYSPISLKEIRSQNNLTGFSLESHSLGETMFQVITEYFPDEAVVNGTKFGPEATKITITIKKFAFKDMSNRLALIIQAASNFKTEIENDVEEREVKIRSNIAEGFFTWDGNVSVDNTTQTVGSSILRERGRTFIALAYPGGQSIVHDPLLGVKVQTSPLSIITTNPFPVASLIVVILSLAVLTYFLKRSRSRLF